MKGVDHRNLAKRKKEIEGRLTPENGPDQPRPVMKSRSFQYEVSDRIRATGVGGIGAIHQMVRRLGVDKAIDETLVLLKRHLPYHESDHVLNIAYSLMAGGTKLEDIELLRQDASYMDLLGAERIPDPTTAGDFLRRLSGDDIENLMDRVNETRAVVWSRQPRHFGWRGVIDVDGLLAPTLGEKKHGMEMSYKGIWGYHPLLISLANTDEPLFIVNRPGNVASHAGCVRWIDKAVELCEGVFEEVWVRGDTAFSLTAELDRWTVRGVRFVFGYDATPNLVEKAAALPETAYRRLVRKRAEAPSGRRRKRPNVKERLVEEKGYENIKLLSEDYAEVEYQPAKCGRPYRLVILRKNLSVERGDLPLFEDVRYFFYITNDETLKADEVIHEANARCDQENVIEQLKNGVNALRVPLHDLDSNWAYMVIASLAWTFKAWFGLTLPTAAARRDVVRMEFKKFLNTVIRIPCQVICGARRIRLRILAYTDRVRLLLMSLRATAALSP